MFQPANRHLLIAIVVLAFGAGVAGLIAVVRESRNASDLEQLKEQHRQDAAAYAEGLRKLAADRSAAEQALGTRLESAMADRAAAEKSLEALIKKSADRSAIEQAWETRLRKMEDSVRQVAADAEEARRLPVELQSLRQAIHDLAGAVRAMPLQPATGPAHRSATAPSPTH